MTRLRYRDMRISGRIVLLSFVFMALFMGFVSPQLSALGQEYFQDSGGSQANCDVVEAIPTGSSDAIACGSGEVRLLVGQTFKVPKSQVQVRAYYQLPYNADWSLNTGAFPTGQVSLTILGANYCPGRSSGANVDDIRNNGWYETHGLPNSGTPVTQFTIGTHSTTGNYRQASEDGCDSSEAAYNRVINLNANDFNPVPGVRGIFYVDFLATHINQDDPPGGGCGVANTSTNGPCDGMYNGFYLSETSSNAADYIIATSQAGAGAGTTCSAGAAFCSTIKNGSNNNLSYRFRFGSDCTVPAGGRYATVSFYDLDYKDSDPVKVRIHDETNDTWGEFDNAGTATTTGVVNSNDWKSPGAFGFYSTYAKLLRSVNGGNSDLTFFARPDHKYVVEVMNVNPTLTMQYATPFDGIYYYRDCVLPTPPVVVPSIQITPNAVEAGGFAEVETWLHNTSNAYNAHINGAKLWLWYSNDPNCASINDPCHVGGRAFNGIDNDDKVYSEDYVISPGVNKSLNDEGTANGSRRARNFIGAMDSQYDYICGSLDVSATPTGPPATTLAPPHVSTCVRIVKTPYLAVYGGDAIVGKSATENGAVRTCSANNPNAGFLSWNRGSGAGWAGAGSQFAVLALGSITSFASAQSTTGGASSPLGLSFANTVNNSTAAEQFGGNFANVDGVGCDYSSDLTLSPNPGAIGNISLANGEHRTLYVRGNIRINGPIGTANTSWANPSEIPSFRLVVVGGNITIDNNVANLYGTYVAEPDGAGNGGIIYTCGVNGVPVSADTNLNASCNSQLTIYGSFVAKQVRFLRTSGSRAYATTSRDFASSAAAERFVFSPAQWLGNTAPLSGGPENSYTGLPPVL